MGVVRDSRNFQGTHINYRVHRSVIFAIAPLSCSSYDGFRTWFLRRNVRVTVYFFHDFCREDKPLTFVVSFCGLHYIRGV